MNKFILLILLFCTTTACVKNTSTGETTNDKLQTVDIKNPVQVIILEKTVFHKELISNGKLKARRKSSLKFDIAGELQEIRTKNGDKLAESSVIAILQQDKIKRKLNQAQLQLARAELELRDILLGQQYKLDDSTEIPENIFRIAKLRSGYSAAINEMQNAKNDLKSTVLRAPFPGLVANIEKQEFEQVNPSDEFCTLIDNSAYEVEFSVLETEISDVSLNRSVKVFPFVNESDLYSGRITEINPVVDENGHIQVKALVENTNGLMEGMNVKVKIETAVPNQLVVPKSAVLIRQDQEVLFKYTTGTAYWTYIQTGLENSTSFTVIAHPDKGASLSPGDTVIVGGNLNLAHGSEVEVEE